MFNRKTLLAGATVAALSSFTFPAVAEVGVYIDLAPPAPRYEHFDARPGYIVAPGYWDYTNGQHQWIAGRYVAERKGYRYEGDRWVQHDNNKWMRQQGGWVREGEPTR